MADHVRCEACQRSGRRPRFHSAPEGWLYLEAQDEEDDEDHPDPILIYACSQECAARLWKIGPGPRWSDGTLTRRVIDGREP